LNFISTEKEFSRADFSVISDLILIGIEFPEKKGRNTVQDLVYGSDSLVLWKKRLRRNAQLQAKHGKGFPPWPLWFPLRDKP